MLLLKRTESLTDDLAAFVLFQGFNDMFDVTPAVWSKYDASDSKPSSYFANALDEGGDRSDGRESSGKQGKSKATRCAKWLAFHS